VPRRTRQPVAPCCKLWSHPHPAVARTNASNSLPAAADTLRHHRDGTSEDAAPCQQRSPTHAQRCWLRSNTRSGTASTEHNYYCASSAAPHSQGLTSGHRAHWQLARAVQSPPPIQNLYRCAGRSQPSLTPQHCPATSCGPMPTRGFDGHTTGSATSPASLRALAGPPGSSSPAASATPAQHLMLIHKATMPLTYTSVRSIEHHRHPKHWQTQPFPLTTRAPLRPHQLSQTACLTTPLSSRPGGSHSSTVVADAR